MSNYLEAMNSMIFRRRGLYRNIKWRENWSQTVEPVINTSWEERSFTLPSTIICIKAINLTLYLLLKNKLHERTMSTKTPVYILRRERIVQELSYLFLRQISGKRNNKHKNSNLHVSPFAKFETSRALKNFENYKVWKLQNLKFAKSEGYEN